MPDRAARPIALDVSHLDHLTVQSGQFRYLADLSRGLASLVPDVAFEMIGSRASPDAEIAELFRRAAHPWRYRRFTPIRTRGAYALNQLRYALRLRASRPALLHEVHTFVPRLAPCPIVVTVYDLMHEIFPEYAAIAASAAHRRFRHAISTGRAHCICISEATANDVATRWNVPRRRLSVVPLGTALGGVRPAPRQLPDDGRDLIVSVYNLEPRKNLEALLVAFSQLGPWRSRARLVLFGGAALSPEREAAFNARLGELGLTDLVTRTGGLSDAELAGLYDRATLFVFPSKYEGFGLPLIEAMSRGTCVIARGVSAMVEVVGDAGILVPADDASAYAAAMRGALDDAARRRTLGERARHRAATFTIDRMAQQTWDVYRAVLDGAR